MGMFGNTARNGMAYDPPPEHSIGAQILNSVGANLLGVNILGQRDRRAAMLAQKAAQDGFYQQLAGMLGPQSTPGQVVGSAPSVSVTRAQGLFGGQAAAAMDDPGAALPSTSPQAAAPDPASSQGQPFGYQPGTTTPGLTINDPRMAPLTLMAQRVGVPMKDLLDVMKAQQPDVMFDRGFGYNKKTGDAVGGFHPDLDKGQTLDANGRVTNLPGALTAATDMAGGVSRAQETAKAGLDLVDVPRPDGSTVKMTRLDASRLLSGQGGPTGGAPRGTAFGPPGGLGVSQTPQDKTYADEGAKAASTTYQAMQTAAQKAPGEIAKYQRLGELLNGYEGGKFSPAMKDFSSAANSLGFTIDKNLPNKEAASAVTNQLALSLRDPSNGGGMPGAMSDADRNFLIQSVPGLVQTAAGRKQMVEAQVKVLQRNQDVAAKARQWQQRFGRIDAPDGHGKSFQDYLDAYAAKHPLFAQQ